MHVHRATSCRGDIAIVAIVVVVGNLHNLGTAGEVWVVSLKKLSNGGMTSSTHSDIIWWRLKVLNAG